MACCGMIFMIARRLSGSPGPGWRRPHSFWRLRWRAIGRRGMVDPRCQPRMVRDRLLAAGLRRRPLPQPGKTGRRTWVWESPPSWGSWDWRLDALLWAPFFALAMIIEMAIRRRGWRQTMLVAGMFTRWLGNQGRHRSALPLYADAYGHRLPHGLLCRLLPLESARWKTVCKSAPMMPRRCSLRNGVRDRDSGGEPVAFSSALRGSFAASWCWTRLAMLPTLTVVSSLLLEVSGAVFASRSSTAYLGRNSTPIGCHGCFPCTATCWIP